MNKTGRKEPHMINNIREKANVRKELNDVKISHFSYLTPTVTVPLLYGSVQNDVLCCQQLHNINYNIKFVHYWKPQLPARLGQRFSAQMLVILNRFLYCYLFMLLHISSWYNIHPLFSQLGVAISIFNDLFKAEQLIERFSQYGNAIHKSQELQFFDKLKCVTAYHYK